MSQKIHNQKKIAQVISVCVAVTVICVGFNTIVSYFYILFDNHNTTYVILIFALSLSVSCTFFKFKWFFDRKNE
jgi:hypothetical protein